MVKPAIIKPNELWTGKQLISTLLINLTPQGSFPLTMRAKSKIIEKIWNKNLETIFPDLSDSEVIINNGELLSGVLDKTQFGSTPYGLIHCFYEIYGGESASLLLSVIGRLFVYYLRLHGFSLGIEDILCSTKSFNQSKIILGETSQLGFSALKKAFEQQDTTLDNNQLISMYSDYYNENNQRKLDDYEREMKFSTDDLQNRVNRECIPYGLRKLFPRNNLQLMIVSGAKGTTVNSMQMSCLLGQIELEGKRPSKMISGRSLPCFKPFDPSPIAGGFVANSFLTGLKPNEYFFHCMAGREGLIDTVVKTSRSGYLQRCIIKLMEGVCVNYDLSVRDSDGSIIQFLYGEDGCDVSKIQFSFDNRFDLFAYNHKNLMLKLQPNDVMDKLDSSDAYQYEKKLQKQQIVYNKLEISSRMFNHKFPSAFSSFSTNYPSKNSEYITKKWFKNQDELQLDLLSYHQQFPLPTLASFHPFHNFGSVSETFSKNMQTFIQQNKPFFTQRDDNEDHLSIKHFKKLMMLKYIKSLCDPGESVGVLAGQSIGEPSTQMTLNTFHFAGRGEMNVTLGIPRLREILMVGSENIKTPTMTIPIRPHKLDEFQKIKKLFTNVPLNKLIESIKISQKIEEGDDKKKTYQFIDIHIELVKEVLYKDKFNIIRSDIVRFIEEKFIKLFLSKFLHKIRNRNIELIVVDAVEDAVKSKAVSGDSDDEQVQTTNEKHSSDDSDSSISDSSDSQESESESDDKNSNDKHSDDGSSSSKMIDEEKNDIENKKDVKIKTSDIDPDSNHSKKENDKETIIKRVTSSFCQLVHYDYDEINYNWCSMVFKFATTKQILIAQPIIQSIVNQLMVYSISNIQRLFVSSKDNDHLIHTEGINIMEMWKYCEILEINKLWCNNIHSMINTYGIEAGRVVLIKEIQNVFGAYGITIDNRHLNLVTDYMTYWGKYVPFNRVGISSSASPLQKMSFEASMSFLKQASCYFHNDSIKSPSARIVVGKPVQNGTNCFDVLMKLEQNLN